MGEGKREGLAVLNLVLGTGGFLAGAVWLVLRLSGSSGQAQSLALGVGLLLVGGQTLRAYWVRVVRAAPPFRKRKFFNALDVDLDEVKVVPRNPQGGAVNLQDDPSAPVPANDPVETPPRPPSTYFATNVWRLEFSVRVHGLATPDQFAISCPLANHRVAEVDMRVDPAPEGAAYDRRYTATITHSWDEWGQQLTHTEYFER